MNNPQLRDELAKRFLKGEKLTIDGMVKEYFEPKSHYAYLIAERKLRYVMTNTKAFLWKEKQVVIAPLGHGTFGIPTKVEEYVYAQTRYYNQVKSLVQGAAQLYTFGKQRSLLPSGMHRESLQLPAFTAKK